MPLVADAGVVPTGGFTVHAVEGTASGTQSAIYVPDQSLQNVVLYHFTSADPAATAADFVGLNKPVQENLNQIAEAFQRDVDELTIVVLDRERHHDLIAQIR